MTCLQCNGVAFIYRVIVTPAHIYGKPMELRASKPCPGCNGTGKVEPTPDFKTRAAGN